MNFHPVIDRSEAESLKDFLREFGRRSRLIKLADGWLVIEFIGSVK